ncbi:hypothetical protein CA13_33070 [Planctomycetes bacterium CA13]|uniref:Cysteine-rich secretory protein family protein n=1 Tax=Novipirellula herctigrandis TaxID=2527986 RepID=A0A5C5Z3I0_9BACT|nr:hypothetical protein CA13_33070 [Planctomycetes bacterium CA13]
MLRFTSLTVGAVIALSGVFVGELPAQNIVVASNQFVCPKCGKIHSSSGVTQNGAAVMQASAISPISSVPRASYSSTIVPPSGVQSGGGVSNVLSALNAQRARSGIGALRSDPALQAVARQRASLMAAKGIKGHPPGSFSPGRYEGVGWSSSYSPAGVSACFTNDSRMIAAGAAMATGRDGVYFCVVYR